MSKPMIYLDCAAATPMLPEVVEAMQPMLIEQFYNPSAQYLAAKSVSHAVNDARGRIAGWLGVRSSEITFTAGGTEADNLAIHGIMSKHPDANIVVSGIEHEAVLEPAHQYRCKETAVKANGTVDLQSLEDSIDDQTVLVSVMYANNEIGAIQPIKKIARLVDDIRASRKNTGNDLPLYFHTDACQAAGYLDLHVSRLGVDMMTINAGKIYGPKQMGALYVKAGIELAPLIRGGGQERGVRSGTENVAAVVGFAKALDIVQAQRHDEVARMQELQQYFIDQIEDKLPNATINGTRKSRLPNNVHVTFPGFDNERLLMELDEKGVMCATGSACSASKQSPSHVLRAIGMEEEFIRSSLRFTMGRFTTKQDVDSVIAALQELVGE